MLNNSWIIDRKFTLAAQPGQASAVIPIVYGTAKVPGKIILSGSHVVPGPNYPVSIQATQIALCEGPIIGVTRWWSGQVVHPTLTESYYAFTLQVGTRTQAPWPELKDSMAGFAVGYGGTAVISSLREYNLDANGDFVSSYFEVRGLFAGYRDQNSPGYDAHPADILADLLTNAEYGAGWSSDFIGAWDSGLDSWRAYCDALGFYVSLLVSNEQPIGEYVQQLMDATNSWAVWSQGKLKVVPLGDVEVIANGVTYTPTLTPVYDLGSRAPGADFLQASPGDDLIEVERSRQADAFNTIPVNYTDRQPVPLFDSVTNAYVDRAPYVTSTQQDSDPVDVLLHGKTVGSTVDLPCVTRASHALVISRIRAKATLYARNTYRFKLPWRFALLEVGDVVTLTDPVMGLDHRFVRISEIEEDEEGMLSFVAMEWTIGQGHAAMYQAATSDSTLRRNAEQPVPTQDLDAKIGANTVTSSRRYGPPAIGIMFLADLQVVDYVFPTPQPDANYLVTLNVHSHSGSSGSLQASVSNRTETGFRVTLAAAPGTRDSDFVVYDFVIIRP
jgi:hypothetical protein